MSVRKKQRNVVCPKCSIERVVSYGQYWNITKGYCSGRCPRCAEGRNYSGLELGRAWNRGLKGYQAGHKPYVMMFGSDNPSWRGGITPINKKIRNSKEYSDWRKSVFQRDNYTCSECGVRGSKLHAHHIKPFSKHPDLRFEVSNGVTMCKQCHKKDGVHSWRNN
jgi:hypothetical protein